MAYRLLAITQAPDDPSTRYRLSIYRPYLQAAGVQVHSVPWPVPEPGRRRLVEAARDFDAVLVQRRLLPCRHVRALRAAARRLVYDFDDSLIYQDSAAGRPWVLLDKLWQFRALLSRCDAVTAGNGFLAELAEAHGARGRIYIVPTVVDPAVYVPLTGARQRLQESRVLGWIGQRSTLPYLEAVREPIQALARRRPGLTLRVIADAAPEMPDVAVEFCRWTAAGEVTELETLDVGLAPLPDDVWTRGKCGLRLLQYLVAGVPAVASPVGTQAAIVRRRAALPACSNHEWVESVGRLLDDAPLRARMVATGRSLVQRVYAPSIWAPRVRAAWCGTLSPSSAFSACESAEFAV